MVADAVVAVVVATVVVAMVEVAAAVVAVVVATVEVAAAVVAVVAAMVVVAMAMVAATGVAGMVEVAAAVEAPVTMVVVVAGAAAVVVVLAGSKTTLQAGLVARLGGQGSLTGPHLVPHLESQSKNGCVAIIEPRHTLMSGSGHATGGWTATGLTKTTHLVGGVKKDFASL